MSTDRLDSVAGMRVNRDASPQVRVIGNERTPVIVIDDFARHPGAVADFACRKADFALEKKSAYPGVRAELSRDYDAAALRALEPLLRATYAVPEHLVLMRVNAVYSLVSTCERDLKITQCAPHVDSNKPYFLAMTHYLNRGDFGGTGFYRHVPTGYEAITEDRVGGLFNASYEHYALHGVPPPRYFRESDGHYELIHRVEYRPNRLLAYPGNLLHTGLIDPARDVNADPRSGRLTMNLFVDFEEP